MERGTSLSSLLQPTQSPGQFDERSLQPKSGTHTNNRRSCFCSLSSLHHSYDTKSRDKARVFILDPHPLGSRHVLTFSPWEVLPPRFSEWGSKFHFLTNPHPRSAPCAAEPHIFFSTRCEGVTSRSGDLRRSGSSRVRGVCHFCHVVGEVQGES